MLQPEKIWPRKVKRKNDPGGHEKEVIKFNQNKTFKDQTVLASSKINNKNNQ